MRAKRVSSSLVLFLFIVSLPLTSEAWFLTHHMKLASKGEQCVSLPKPPKKRCALPVDDILLKAALWWGSIEPDFLGIGDSPGTDMGSNLYS